VKRAALLLLLCCGPAPTVTVPPDPDAQTALFRFNTTDSVRMNANLKRLPIGNVYGSIFFTRDVTVFGPNADAGAVAEVAVKNVDVRAGLADAGFVTPQLAPGQYTFLGELDTDDDGGSSGPTAGDIVTLSTTNQFEIDDGGAQLHKTIVFDLVYTQP